MLLIFPLNIFLRSLRLHFLNKQELRSISGTVLFLFTKNLSFNFDKRIHIWLEMNFSENLQLNTKWNIFVNGFHSYCRSRTKIYLINLYRSKSFGINPQAPVAQKTANENCARKAFLPSYRWVYTAPQFSAQLAR